MFNDKKKYAQFLRFCTVGLGNTSVDFAAFFILSWAGIPYLLAQVLSYSAGVLNSFIFNRKWTFKVTGKTNLAEIMKFIFINSFSILVSSCMLFILHDINSLNIWLAKIAATGIAITVNYLGSRIWVFAANRPITGNYM
ncbi:MAG: GtrA family protein [Syntrophomonas sp.]|nr:GtrA family protein [Syntrophomonas sp.]